MKRFRNFLLALGVALFAFCACAAAAFITKWLDTFLAGKMLMLLVCIAIFAAIAVMAYRAFRDEGGA